MQTKVSVPVYVKAAGVLSLVVAALIFIVSAIEIWRTPTVFSIVGMTLLGVVAPSLLLGGVYLALIKAKKDARQILIPGSAILSLVIGYYSIKIVSQNDFSHWWLLIPLTPIAMYMTLAFYCWNKGEE